ncbi:hypothetical protein Mapa_010459 [Marchantia paleacea]|nr:hypothetical protein Mapa_010459 [Marchantia paleacea]
MPSNKRRSSTGGHSTPSKPPLPLAALPDGRSTPSPPQTPASGRIGTLGTPRRDGEFCSGSFNATVVAVDDKDSKGRALIWLSEQAMLSTSIATGSLIYVNVLAPIGHPEAIYGSLDSVRDASVMECGLEVPRNSTFGAAMAVSIAWPSKKLVKNEVRISRVLSYSLGSPVLGTSLSLNSLKCQRSNADSTRASIERHDPIGALPAVVYECSEISLRWCPVQHSQQTEFISVLRRFPSFRKDELAMSSPSVSTPRRQGHQESDKGRAVSSSPASRFPFSGSTKSPVGGESNENTIEHEKSNDALVEQHWDSVWAAFGKGKENVRSLMEGFAARWLAGRYLLPGNIVHVSLCGADCLMLVTETKALVQSDISTGKVAPSPSNHEINEDIKVSALSLAPSPETVALYRMSLNTRVTLLPPPVKKEESVAESQYDVDTSARSEAVQGDKVEGLSADVGRIEYSSLGGLSAQINKLREQVELSLIYPHILSRYGLQPVRGVLLYGPPGTGKSSLARAAACEAGVKMFAVNGPEIVSEFYGESESALRAVFTTATKEGPSVVFIDELDAIVPERKEGGEELGQRLVAALLTVMDGGAEDTLKGVLVIAATNRIDSIDPALRRPGRFDLEIEIGVPSPSDRLGILQVLLRDLRHTLNTSDISDLAATTHGFVGADLAALCNEAAMSTLRRIVHLRQSSLTKEIGPGDESSNVVTLDVRNFRKQIPQGQESLSEVTVHDFQVAKTKVRPSAMREVALEVPKVQWNDIGGHEDVKQKLKEIVEWPQKQTAAIARMGVDPPHGVLLHGPPGCSKTLMARAVASETGLNFIAVKGPELFSKWVGESEKAVKNLFARARAAAPSVVFFDEIDGLAVKRESSHGDGVSVGDRVMSQLLTEMDGLVPMKGISVVAATNRLDIIDSALLRPGRFDRILYVGPPDEDARRQIFGIHLGKMPYSPDVCISSLAAMTSSYTGADISAVCREAAMIALEEDVNVREVRMCHLDTAIARVKPSSPVRY